MDEHVNHIEFVKRLRGLVEKRASATLRLITDDRHFVSIGLHNGLIVSVMNGPRRGARALQGLTTVSGGGLSLLPEQEFPPQPDLPPTHEILRLLDDRHADSAPDPIATPQAARAGLESVPLWERQSTMASLAVSPQDLDRVETALRRFIGPIAKMVMQDTLSQLGRLSSQQDLVRLVEMLSREIDDSQQAQRFTELALPESY